MKKIYKLIIGYDDTADEIDNLTETLEEETMDHIWLDTGDITIQLPDELIPYLEASDILGIA